MGLFFNRSANKVTRIAAPAGAVRPSSASLMQQRGWTPSRIGSSWSGPYATRHSTWPGQIDTAGDTFRVYIKNPPSVLRKHPRWICFAPLSDGAWYAIHLAVPPSDRDPNAIIRYVEQIITESFKL